MTRRRRRKYAPAAAEVLESRALLTAGALDTSFAGTGIITIEDFGAGIDAEIQDDGKVIVGGYGNGGGGVIVRYNSDGTPDLPFGAIGAVGFTGKVGDIEILDDGKILVATTENSEIVLNRINPDGTVDTTFGTGGEVQTGLDSTLPEIEVDSAGRIVVARSDTSGGLGPIAGGLNRFNADGTVDLTFGTNGGLDLAGVQLFSDLAIDANDNIALASQSLYKVDSSGQLDTSFNGTGIISGAGEYFDVAFADDGTIYVAGGNADSSEGQVAAYDAAGVETAVFNFAGNLFASVAVDNNGDVVAGIGNYVVAEGDTAIVRFDSALNQDTGFGTVAVGTDQSIRDIEIDDSGRIVGAGFGVDQILLTRVVQTNDLPEANDDTASITEDADPDTVSGNVLDNDTDSAPLVVSEVNGVAASVGVSVATTYGSIVINADGSYVYTLDNSNPTVQALNSSQSLTDSIAYTALDDCDATDIANLEITINGADDEETPADKLDNLFDEVDSMVENGDISGRSGRYLTRTLDRVRRALDEGRTQRARTLVRSFRTQVVVLYVSRRISLTDAQNLFGLGGDLLNSL